MMGKKKPLGKTIRARGKSEAQDEAKKKDDFAGVSYVHPAQKTPKFRRKTLS